MATTCQQVVARAAAFSALNASLTTDPAEMLARIGALQQQVWTATVAAHRAPFVRTDLVTAPAAPVGTPRRVPLTAFPVPIERLLLVRLQDGTPVAVVDPLDVAADLAPRVIADGGGLLEVGTDWGTAGAVVLQVTYDAGPAAIDPNGTLSQVVSLDDAWADLLVVPLALYLAQKDPGRDPTELERLTAMQTATESRWDAYCTHRYGTPATRFVLPTPRDVQG